MRHLPRVAILATVLTLAFAGVAHGGGTPRSASSAAGDTGAHQHGAQHDRGRSHPNASLEVWLARYWTTIFTLPADRNPYAGTGDLCVPLDRRTIAPFLLPPDAKSPLTCTVRPGTRVLVLGAIAECSNVEAGDFHAETYREAIACAKAWIGNLTRHEVIVDERRRIDLLRGHSAATSYLTAQLPANNIFGAEEGTTIRSASFGYGVLLRPLRPGQHIITVEQEGQADNPNPVSPTFSVTIVVEPGHGA